MECNKYRSVLSIMDPLSARRSYELVSLSPTSFTPVSRKPLSFSISAILGLDEKRDQDFPITGKLNCFIFCRDILTAMVKSNS